MGRKFAQIQLSIWSDPDFKSLDRDLQHTFFVLLSQPRINLCGVLDYRPRRLAQCAGDWPVDDVERDIKELEARRYVVVDRDTDEMLIRSFIRHDGLLTQPNVAQGMSADYGEVMSDKLRDVIEAELRRAYLDDPDLKGWVGGDGLGGVKKGNPILYRRVVMTP
ncbi:hypothetical protein GCM10022234_00590 [Aeromicrobium panaciterrae]|uniref:hypothetical protein n=1 Tax=Aeromicrobium panaciterrae TaxID=363861 RepID=UPI0031DD1DF0